MIWSIKKIAFLSDSQYEHLKVYNIIGDKDRILQEWSNPNTNTINGGSHFMVYDKAAEVTKVLRDILRIEQNGQ